MPEVHKSSFGHLVLEYNFVQMEVMEVTEVTVGHTEGLVELEIDLEEQQKGILVAHLMDELTLTVDVAVDVAFVVAVAAGVGKVACTYSAKINNI